MVCSFEQVDTVGHPLNLIRNWETHSSLNLVRNWKTHSISLGTIGNREECILEMHLTSILTYLTTSAIESLTLLTE